MERYKSMAPSSFQSNAKGWAAASAKPQEAPQPVKSCTLARPSKGLSVFYVKKMWGNSKQNKIKTRLKEELQKKKKKNHSS